MKIVMQQSENYANVESRRQIGERSLLTSHIRVGRGVQDSPPKGRYRVGQVR